MTGIAEPLDMVEENYIGLEDKREQLFKDMKKEFSNGSLMAAAIPVSCYKFCCVQLKLNKKNYKLFTTRMLQIKKDKKGKEGKVCTESWIFVVVINEIWSLSLWEQIQYC